MTPLPLLLRRVGQVIPQDRFGCAVGVHRTYMGLVERGLANPTINVLHGVANRLGISVLDLLRLAMTEDSANKHRGRRPGRRAIGSGQHPG